MSVQELIKEFKALPSEDRSKVQKFFYELESSQIPDSFWRGLQEADEGKVMELREEHFDNPPA